MYGVPTVCQALVWDLGVYMLMAIEIKSKPWTEERPKEKPCRYIGGKHSRTKD